jgi:hypothetical protein
VILGEIANFAAYAFAPAILVTPLGALSVLIGAVLGSYFLKEVLGTLGKLGCAICLIGSVMIVLHAPPDKDIQTIDEILHFAIQPGTVCSMPPKIGRLTYSNRIPAILLVGLGICRGYDIQSWTEIWQEESYGLHLDLLDCGSSVSHVSQGIRYCAQTHYGWKQPVHAPFDIRLRYFNHSLYLDTDELS